MANVEIRAEPILDSVLDVDFMSAIGLMTFSNRVCILAPLFVTINI